VVAKIFGRIRLGYSALRTVATVGTTALPCYLCNDHIDDRRLAAPVGFKAALQRILKLLRIRHLPPSRWVFMFNLPRTVFCDVYYLTPECKTPAGCRYQFNSFFSTPQLLLASPRRCAVNARDQFYPRSRNAAGLSRFPGSPISYLPSVKRQSGTAEELVDLGKSDTISPRLAPVSLFSSCIVRVVIAHPDMITLLLTL